MPCFVQAHDRYALSEWRWMKEWMLKEVEGKGKGPGGEEEGETGWYVK